jgi:DNA-binding SARP family transcriptional activator
MTKKQIEDLSENIVKLIFEKLEDDARVMQEDPSEWLDIMVTDEQQMKELELLIQYYEVNEDFTKAASAFKQLSDLRKIQRENE